MVAKYVEHLLVDMAKIDIQRASILPSRELLDQRGLTDTARPFNEHRRLTMRFLFPVEKVTIGFALEYYVCLSHLYHLAICTESAFRVTSLLHEIR